MIKKFSISPRPRILFLKPYNPVGIFYIAPPLGLIYIASILREAGINDVRLMDMRLYAMSPEDIITAIKSFSPDIVGISAMTYEAEITNRLSSVIKSIRPQCLIVVGGPHASASPHATINSQDIDFVIQGEGEIPFKELVTAVMEKLSYQCIKGLGFKSDGNVIINPPHPPLDVNTLPFPAWDTLDLPSYFGSHPKPGILFHDPRYMLLIASRGCPFQCIFCHNIFGKRIRKREPHLVISEVYQLYHRYGIRDFHFMDDCFNIYTTWASEILDGIVASGMRPHIHFSNGLRADHMDEELLKRMKRAGVYKITYSVESASPRIQKMIRKGLDLDKVLNAIEITDRLGILTHGSFMLGFPTETMEEMRQTVRFALSSKLHMASFFIVNPFEGTPLAEMVESSGFQRGCFSGSHNFYHSDVRISHVTPKRLNKLVKSAYRRFSFKPWRIYRMIRLLPRKHQVLDLIGQFITRVLKGLP